MKNKKLLEKLVNKKSISIFLIVFLSLTFFAFGGINGVKSAFVNLQKMFDAGSVPAHTKNKLINGDGTFKLSLDVTGEVEEKVTYPKVNVLIIFDTSSSMNNYFYVPSKTGRYGLSGKQDYFDLYSAPNPRDNNSLITEDNYEGTVYRRTGGNGTYYSPYTYEVYTGDRFANIRRAAPSEQALHKFLDDLYEFQDPDHPENIQTALVTFDGGARTLRGWTSQESQMLSGNNWSVHNDGKTYGLQYNSGTNWERGIREGLTLINSADDDPTYVLFFTDGEPTRRGTQGSNNGELEQNYQAAAAPALQIQQAIEENGGNFYGIYAYGKEDDWLATLTYYVHNNGDVSALTPDQYGHYFDTDYYFYAEDTNSLESAMASIFKEVTAPLGITKVSIKDGTTTSVATSGGIAHLLEVDEDSYEYWMSMNVTPVAGESNQYTMVQKDVITGEEYTITFTDNQNDTVTANWTHDGTHTVVLEGSISSNKFQYHWKTANDFYNYTPNQAQLVDDAVNWNLSNVGTLLDGVTYTVTFDVYPSQETYDTIADLKNGVISYNDLENVQKYLIDNHDGTYSLKTNTTATLTYTDSREENPTSKTSDYTNPDPVPTEYSMLDIEKIWLNELDEKNAPSNTVLEMNLLRDGKDTGLTIDVSKSNNWRNSTAIATGLLRTKTDSNGNTYIQVLDDGHDYTLTEPVIQNPEFETYHWEFDMETVHPMIIDGQLTTLVQAVGNEIPTIFTNNPEVNYYTDGMYSYYKINSKVYYNKAMDARLNAYNSRKSNFNFIKKVEGDAIEGEKFDFTFTIDNKTGIPEESDDVWFSVCDTNIDPNCINPSSLIKNIDTNATPETKNGELTGYYYIKNKTPIHVALQDGWNVRVTNLGTGSTFNIVESQPTTPYELTDISGTIIVKVPELPANAVKQSDGIYKVGDVIYTQVTETDSQGKVHIYYEYEYTPNISIANRTVSGTIVAPNNEYAVTYTNTYPKTHLDVEKIFIGDKKEVEINLYRTIMGGTEEKVASQKLNNRNEWKYTFKDLDVYDENGNIYTYYTKETPLASYQTTYDGIENIEITASNIPIGTTEVEATLTIGTDKQTILLNEENNWKTTIEKIHYLNEDGTIKYIAVTSDSSAILKYNFTSRKNIITNEERTTISGTKTWDDANNQDGVRPSTIIINLLADGEKITSQEVSPDANGIWTYSFNDLPKYRYDETTKTYVKIIYAITEDKVDYYEDPSIDGFDVINTHNPFETELTVIKKWDDANNQDGLRPSSVQFVILKDGVAQQEIITLNELNHWTYKAEHLPRKVAGRDIVYSVREVTPNTDYKQTDYDQSDPEKKDTVVIDKANQIATITVTNTHEPSTIRLNGTKTWDDADNQDGLRPATILVTLKADGKDVLNQAGQPVSVTLPNADGTWTYDFGEFPEYLAGNQGHKITYTVEETLPDGTTGYTTTYVENTLDIVNSHTPETVDKNGTKTWDDANNQDGLRPASITVQLLADGQPVEGKTQTVTAANGWTYTFANLPKYKNGNIIIYTVTDTVTGYTATEDSMNLKNTHKPETVDKNGTKTWDDANNQDGLRPASITVQLLADGQPVDGKTQTVTAANGWTYSFEGLPKYKNVGTIEEPVIKEIIYTVTDTVTGYTATRDSMDLKNTHKPETIDVEGEKVWDDANNQDGLRPTSVTITLYADGVATKTTTTTAADNWAFAFTNLPKKSQGKEIVYTVKEANQDVPTGYTQSIDGTTITNKHIPGKVNVEGSKTWDDANNQDGKRPTSIKVTLIGTTKDKTVKTETITVTEEDEWSWSWKDLPEYDNGQKITYTISEEKVTDYEDPKINGYDVKNTHKPETTQVSGKKTWTDADNQDGLRPASIQITLTGTITENETTTIVKEETITVTAAEGWAWNWNSLPKYNRGKEIHYEITEGKVEYYDTTVNGFDVINTHNPFETELTVIKNWDDLSNQDGLRPSSVQFVILKDGVAQQEIITLNEDNHWTYKAEHLPRKVAGRDIVYSVREVTQDQNYKQDDYDQSDPEKKDNVIIDNANQIATITVTNKHTPSTIEVSGKKTWDDDNNRDNIRPTSITINLFANDTKIDSKVVTAADGWAWKWTDLPEFASGKKINYIITEEKVDGYKSTIDGYDVINTHEYEKTSIDGKKVWDDDNDRDGKRPNSVTITLYADGVATKTTTTTADDGWAFAFTNLPKKNQGKDIVYTVKEADKDIPAGYTQSVNGTTITNTHKPEKTSVNGKKVWNDDSDRDGKRPASITINVKDQDDLSTIVKSQVVQGTNIDDEWSYTIDGLNKYKNGGTLITYVVEEIVPEGYQSVTDGTTITNTYEPQKVNVPITKTWIDTENYRPKSIKIALIADKVEVEGSIVEVTPDADGNWTYTYKDLPKYKNHGNDEIVYSAIEKEVDPNYTVSYPEDRVIVNTIKDLEKDIPVTKIWDDANNQDGKRPTSIKVNLTGTIQGKTGQEVVYTASIDIMGESWKGVFEKVPIFHEGTLITYSIEEVLPTKEAEEAYTSVVIANDGDGFKITNSHTPETKPIKATKIWDDADDNDGKRPASVKIALLADGEKIDEKTATEETNWEVLFEDLPVYSNGKKIEYTVMELDVNEHYIGSVEGTTITNKHEPATITYTVIKNWNDFENVDGVRPDFIIVHLYEVGNSQPIQSQRISVAADGSWSYTFANLPKYRKGQLIQYTITEDNVDLYTTLPIIDVENKEETKEITNTITNEHTRIPYNENGSITVNKYWYDDNNKYKKRPTSITVNLFADEELIASAVLNAANNWTYTFTGLNKYKDGEVGVEIKYSIQEVAVENYKTTIEGFNIINTYDGPPVPEITPPNTGVMISKQNNNNVLFEVLISLLSVSYTVVILETVKER